MDGETQVRRGRCEGSEVAETCPIGEPGAAFRKCSQEERLMVWSWYGKPLAETFLFF